MKFDVLHQRLVADGSCSRPRASMTFLPKRGPAWNINFQIRGASFSLSWLNMASYALMRALPLACRPLGRHVVSIPARGPGSCGVRPRLLSSSVEALLLLLQPRRIVALPRNAPPAVQLQNPARHVVQEIAVVRHRDDRTRETSADSAPAKPRTRRPRWLVGSSSSRMSGFCSKQAAQGHAATLRRPEMTETGVSPGGQRKASIAISRLGVQGPTRPWPRPCAPALCPWRSIRACPFHRASMGSAKLGVDIVEFTGSGPRQFLSRLLPPPRGTVRLSSTSGSCSR